MVRNRTEWTLFVAGLIVALLQIGLPALGEPFAPPAGAAPTAAVAPPSTSRSVPVIWREFRPGERETGPSNTLLLCGAALERGLGRSALVLRFCSSIPTTPQRLFALGYDDLAVRARLPGGGTLAYDMVRHDASAVGAARFTRGPSPENDAPIVTFVVKETTDAVFVIGRELPVGLPSIEVSARYLGAELRDARTFEPLGPDLERSEAERVASAPAWARAPY